MESIENSYLPAAGHDFALPLYDPLVKILGADSARKALIEQAGLRSSHRILDIGCGTGTMAIVIKQLHPSTHVTGLDPDPRALARANRKAARSGLSVQFDRGFSGSLPYSDGLFDRVFSSLMFHHLPPNQKESTFSEIRRVLKRGGSLHLLDFAGPDDSPGGWLTRLLHSSHHLRDNSEARILTLMRRAGFADSRKVMQRRMLFGSLRLSYFQASREH